MLTERGGQHPAWPAGLRDACQTAGVPYFFKQWGGPTPKAGGRLLDGPTWDDMPETEPVGVLASGHRGSGTDGSALAGRRYPASS
ncbi:MAG: DUF5131 family protein, partial [Actinobacteria bacterium]|nr:DUF5131 family protein [Actinomycetota bacterium]